MSNRILNKEILTSLRELVSPQHTALIIVDAQNDFCSPGGFVDKLSGADMRFFQLSIECLVNLLRSARQTHTMIVYTQATNRQDLIFKSAPDIARKIEYLDPTNPLLCIEGKWGYEIIDILKPLPGEIVIKKQRHSSFEGTELDILLRSNGIKTVIVTGFTTERCVLATVTGAIAKDYYVVVAKDCVAAPRVDMHNAALLVIQGNLCKHGVVDSKQIIEIWHTLHQT
jgi:nicotinamidase-related amidase